MGVKEVKQYWIASCDCCGKTKDTTTPRTPTDWVHVDVLQSAVDYQGHAVADKSAHLSFCRTCGLRVNDAMNAAVAAIRAELSTPTKETTE